MYKPKPTKKLIGSEYFINKTKQDFSVLDFWQYGFSNLNSNVLRGALAEFIVENALKSKKQIGIRNPWGDYDIDLKNKKIEVKSCAYLQDWEQEKLSAIRWSGLKAKTLYWSSAVSSGTKKQKVKEYKADVYVLSLLDHKDHETLNITDLTQWKFYVLSKNDLKKFSKDSNSISLSRLEKNGVESVSFENLKSTIAKI